MNKSFNKLYCLLLGCAIPWLGLPNAYSDDTEIFYNAKTLTPKVMMILDTSLSMSIHVKGGESRLTQMKRAMSDFIRQSDGIQIGLMRMNQRSGAVIYPITDLNTTITEILGAINRPITVNKNNAYEQHNGQVIINYADTNSGELSLVASQRITLRFENISIPQGQVIHKASLEFFPKSFCTKWLQNNNGEYRTQKVPCPNIPLQINGEKTADSSPFSAVEHQLSQRSLTNNTQAISINNWGVSDGSKLLLPKVITIKNLAGIVQEIVEQNDWKNGNALSLIINSASVQQVFDNNDITNDVGIHSALSRYSPTLFIEFAPYTRTISSKEKMIEELDNQKLTSHTPIVPALFEATKYLQGALINSQYTPLLSLTRSANERIDKDKVHERVPYASSYKNGAVLFPANCHLGNLNSALCKNMAINSLSTQQAPTYISPLNDSCSDDEASIVLLTDGEAHHKDNAFNSGQWWREMTLEIAQLTNDNGAACINNSNDNTPGNAQTCGVELAKKLGQGISVNGLQDKQKVSLYTIGFNNNDAWLTTLAGQGEDNAQAQSRYSTATNASELLQVFNKIKRDMLNGAATFSNSAASVNTSNRLSHNDTLFFSLFQPNEQSSWPGNLKRYRLKSSGEVVDINGNIAINKSSGQFIDNAQSWWSASADGSVVTNGGAASRLQQHSRKIYLSNDSMTLTKLDQTSKSNVASEFSNADFSAPDTAAKIELIDWMLANKSITDPLHSTPTEITYTGSSVVFFGDNQGYIHAIDSSTGNELWAFMPKELLKNQRQVSTNIMSKNHIYGMDGEMVKWQQDNGNYYLYSGMRRGGKSYYALDVSNRLVPKLQWVINAKTAGFSSLGQTWSKPIKTKLLIGGNAKDVLIFGGGYDPIQDNVNTRTSGTIGDSVYIVDASTGSLIWSKTGMGYSIPSDIKAIDLNNDGNVDQLYVGDMGGQVWRFDVKDSSSSNSVNISAAIIANLSDDNSSGNRRFYHAPDVSVFNDNGALKLAIAIGSGYRAHPNSTAVQDAFFVIKQPIELPNNSSKILTMADLY
ncbi:MAG: PQQ-binding-like beta-propeller repeat protein, partial [Psychrobium sp.]|nr:PQQ-binding-like beta-propeller repeat protein [Psychrobium sp.]